MTDSNLLIPAAQYLRMSTEHQRYSLANQSAAIAAYAQTHGFAVVLTYFDPGRSGLVLRRRPGLRQLLQDVVAGTASYRAILVYDVSRWGRFQDADESAHYEFLCKSAGVPVHYCGEMFSNDGSMASIIMKVLKRTMAAEYSREMGVKIVAAQRRLAGLGFKQGSYPPFGLRRMLLSADRTPKQQLAKGDWKSLATDRVILIPGPESEIRVVREIYRMFISENRTIDGIALELNARGVKYVGDSEWAYHSVRAVLTNPKYIGCQVFGKTSSRLSTRRLKVPSSDWVITPGAFAPVVDEKTFSDAQRTLAARNFKPSDENMIAKLRALLASEGRLTVPLIRRSKGLPAPCTYRNRFGGLRRAYALAGYVEPRQFSAAELRRKTQGMREELMKRIAAMHPGTVTVVPGAGTKRTRLRLRSGLFVSVLMGRLAHVWKSGARWLIDPIPRERRLVTLVARLDERNESFLDFHLFPKMERRARFGIYLSDPWLQRGVRLTDLREFCDAVGKVRGR